MLSKFMKLANEVFINGGDEIKKEVVSIIASNIVIKDQKIASFKIKEPFVWLLKDSLIPITQKATFEPSSFGYNKTKTTTNKVAVSSMFGNRDSNPN